MKPIWEKKRPKSLGAPKKLSAKQKASAKASAKKMTKMAVAGKKRAARSK